MEILTRTQAAAELNVHPSTITRWGKSGCHRIPDETGRRLLSTIVGHARVYAVAGPGEGESLTVTINTRQANKEAASNRVHVPRLPATTRDVARATGVSDALARWRMSRLERDGLVARSIARNPGRPGRPAVVWHPVNQETHQ